MTATTAPDFRLVRTDVPRLDPAPGTSLTLLVLAANGVRCSGVDLGSGVLVRTWAPAAPETRLRAYDLAEVVVAADPEEVPDPAAPEALVLAEAPVAVGRMAGRRVERLLRPLLHPSDEALLSSHGPAIAFWERRADHPSIALAEPAGPILLRREGNFLGCRFEWQAKARELPCLDRRLAAVMDRDGRRVMEVEGRSRILVSLTPPIDGHCHKVVEAVLPRR